MSDTSDNPYSSPPCASEPSKTLSKSERKALEFYRAHRHHRLSMLSVALRNFPVWAVVIGLITVVYFLARLPQGPGPNAAWVLALLIGLFAAGAITRDLGYARRTAKMWPLIVRVLDWEKIDQLIDEQ